MNAIIHADWEGRTSLLIKHAPTGFRIRNPGLPRLPNEQIFSGGVSDCRNRTLQGMFLHVGLGENAGSGFHRILRAWREQSWRYPTLTQNMTLDLTTLTLAMVHMVPEAVLARLDERFGSAFRELPETQRTAMVMAAHEGKVTHERLHELLDDHPRDLTLALHGLVQKRMLQSHGYGRHTHYTIPQRDADSTANDAGSMANDASSTANDASSTANDASSAANDSGSALKDPGSTAKDLGS
ncbi:MAG: AAA family ATPase, partial [Oligoflexia bacterium]|nr:AAA family ATPase [Oligoflexia bacterium]